MDIDNDHDDEHDNAHGNEHGNDKGDEGVRCSFAEVDLEFPGGQVKAVTSIIKNDNHYNNEDDGRSPVELQVLPKHIYIGHKYKTKWSAVTNVTVEEEHDDDGDIVIVVVITCPTFTVVARGPPHPQRGQGQGQGQGQALGTGTGLLSVSACSKYLLKRWHKRQRKVQRKLEQEKEHANKNKNKNTTSRKNASRLRTSTKGRTSKASTFLLKNAHNMREWESDDDQVFNRLPPKELKRRQQQERQEEEEEEQQDQQDGAATGERDNDDDDEQEACFENDASNLNEDADDTMVEEQAEEEMTQDQDQDHHVPLDDDSDNEEKDVPPPPKTTNVSGKPFKGLKRRRILEEEEEEDSDDDDLFGAPLPDVTTPMAQRIVSPGTTTNTLRTGVIDDEDDDDDENDNENNIMTDSETDKEEPPLVDKTSSKPTTSKPVVSKNMASFFAPKVTPVAMTKTALVTETATATTTTKKRVAAPNFFAPRKAAASVVVVTTETTTKTTTPTKVPVALALEEEEEMFVSTPTPFVSTPTPNDDCPMTPPRSSAAKRSLLLTSVYQSAKKLQLDVHSDDDPIIEESDDEDPKQHPPLLLSPRFRSPLKQRLGGGAMAASNMKKRRLFRTYGSKSAPLRNTASSALDMAEAKSVSSSPVRHRSPFASMDATGKRLLSPRRLSPAANQPNVLATTPTTMTPTTTRITSPATRKHVLPKWRGLKNLGNTCYMNSSLQFLYSVPSFVQSLQQRRRTKKGAGTGAAGVRRLTQAFCQTYQALQTSAPGAVLARPLKTAMDAATTKFQGFQQRDAHEFLGELLDQLHEELEGEDAAAAPAPDSGASVGEEKTEKNDDFRGEEKKEEDLSTSGTTTNTTDEAVVSSTNRTTTSTTTADSVLPTDDFFRLTVEVCLQCKSCGYSRTKEEMYRYLSVDIDTPTQENTKPTVTQCLAQFFQPEDRDIKCEKCEEGTHATQTLKILERPKALLLHLKRFVVVESKREDQTVDISFKKNRSAVDLTSSLSLDAFCKANSSDINGEENGAYTSSTSAMAKAHTHPYALKSVVHHIGSTANSGHYTADALRTTTKTKEEEEESHPQWVSYDDGITMETSFAKVQSSVQNQRTAYMLLYSTV